MHLVFVQGCVEVHIVPSKVEARDKGCTVRFKITQFLLIPVMESENINSNMSKKHHVEIRSLLIGSVYSTSHLYNCIIIRTVV